MDTRDIKVYALVEQFGHTPPKHITIKRESTKEFVHLYFDEGSLIKFVYLAPDRTQEGKYEVKMAYRIDKGQYRPMSSFIHTPEPEQSFYYFKTKSNQKAIYFSEDFGMVSVMVLTDLNGKCSPTHFIHNYFADLKIEGSSHTMVNPIQVANFIKSAKKSEGIV